MSQNIVDFSGNPTGSGLLDDYLDKELQNILTSNSGIQRPSYAVAGTKWLDTSVTPWLWKMYDGTEDVVIGTVDTSAHKFVGETPMTTTGDLIVQNEDGNPARLASGTAGTVLTSNGVGQIPSWQKSPYQTTDNLSQTLDTSTEKYPSNAAVKAAIDTKITNCLTAIPQDIKLELNNGTLTLKAGSKLYKGNSTFIVTEEDKSITGTNASAISFYDVENNSLEWRLLSECYSQDTAPTNTQYMLWLDTTNKTVKATSDTGATWHECTLPTCTFTADSIQITSIDQVFNGFGYIGSTIFALPGVKGLIPNGRNEDGSFKNIEFMVGKVSIQTTNTTFTDKPFSVSENGVQWINYLGEFTTPPAVQQYKCYYNPIENKLYFAYTSDSWEQFDRAFCGRVSSNGKITSLTPKTAFHAFDENDVDSRIIDIMNSLYPVGSIYLGTQSTCPLANLIPNSTWELIAADRVLQGASSNHAAGTTIEAGLPNITGSFSASCYGYTETGAFSEGSRVDGPNGNNNGASVFTFNASRSSSIYGNSSTVQPPAYVVNIWKRTA